MAIHSGLGEVIMTNFERMEISLLEVAKALAQPCPARGDVTPSTIANAASVSEGDWIWSLLFGHLRRASIGAAS